MGLYQIDDKIINHYLDGDDIELYRYDNVYSFGPGNEKYFIEPNPHLINKAKLLNEGVKNIINNLNLETDDLVLKYLGDIKPYLNNIVIKLVVGMPLGYHRMFKSDEETGKLNIIIDITNNLSDDLDIDLYLNDFKDYIEYAIILMILDSNGPSEIDDPYKTLTHGIFASSFASYISESKQLELMDNINFIQFIENDEHNVLKRVLKNNKDKRVGRYLSLVVQSNPEMVLLGITGKRYLSTLEEDKVFELYNQGAEVFCQEIVNSKVIKERSFLPNMIKHLRRIAFLAGVLLVGLIVYSFFNGMNMILKIFGLIFLGILLLRNFAENKIGLMSNKKFLIYGAIITLIAIGYIIMML